MAYNLAERFSQNNKYYVLRDPGAYQYEDNCKTKPNKYPFLSKTPRNTQPGSKLWTHAIYGAEFPRKIPNCTSLMNKQPRFPYEALSQEDNEHIILCRCGLENPCECSDDDKKIDNITCQGKVTKILYKGHPPRSSMGGGLSVPSKNDEGFSITLDNSIKRVRRVVMETCDVFYDARINYSTDYYHGWKWSKWRSQRSIKTLANTPGPSEYYLEKHQNDFQKCADLLRSKRRKTSKQLRFIEMVQSRNIEENLPGPGFYSPDRSKGTNLQMLGPKTERFPSSENSQPGPSDYWLKRDFDALKIPRMFCHAKLPDPACFGTKTLRFKSKPITGPSPCSYYPKYKSCRIMHCTKTGFSSSVMRFKENKIEDKDVEELVAEDEPEKMSQNEKKPCPIPTWGFKSKTIRMKPLLKKIDEPSPADLPQSKIKIVRSQQLQHNSPFFSSQCRFHCWYNWLPVHGKLNTPGPGYYNLEKLKSSPVVKYGPLHRAARFNTTNVCTPAPNEYEVNYKNIEHILETNNIRLKNHIRKSHEFAWISPRKQALTLEEREIEILKQSIALLNPEGIFEIETPTTSRVTKNENKDIMVRDRSKNTKLLRCFLFEKQIKNLL